MFHRGIELEQLWDGDMAACRVDGHKVLLVRLGGDVFAFEDRCAHLAVPLSTGTLDGGVLTCRAHGYQYDARTGRGINPATVRIRRYPVELRDGYVLVDVEGEVP